MGEEQKIVAGATRTITHAADSTRPVKEWDKATGVYTYSVEQPKYFTVISQAISTNRWSYQILGLNQTVFNALEAVIIVLAVLVVSSVVFVARRNKIRKLTLRYPSQGKIATIIILAVILVTIGAIVFFPFSEIDLSFAEINLIMQTLWTGLILVSMWVGLKAIILSMRLQC